MIAALKNLDEVQKALNSLRAAIAEKRSELQAIHAEIANALQAPPNRDSAAKVLETAINGLCDSHIAALWANLGLYVADRENANRVAINLREQVSNCHIRDTGLVALLRPALLAGIGDAVAHMDWPADAISDEKRDQRLAELEPHRLTLQSELDNLESNAARLGLV